MSLKVKVAGFLQKAESWFSQLPPDIRADAVQAATDLKDAAETEADVVAAKIAGPVFGPEVVAVLNQVIDSAIASEQAALSARVGALQAAKQILAPAQTQGA